MELLNPLRSRSFIDNRPASVTPNSETPNATFPLRSEEFGEFKDGIVVVCYNSVRIYDKNLELQTEINGLKIRASFDVHQEYLYMVNDMITEPWTVIDLEGGETKEEIQVFNRAGFYILDLHSLVKGKVVKYKLLNGIGGFCSNIDRSIFSDRLTIGQSFDQLTVVPFPHLNMINFMGMQQKSDYLIWREKNGFFSALTNQNVLTTWSLINGKNLYSENCDLGDGMDDHDDYEVYRASKDDVTYTRNFYNKKDETVTLLMNKYAFQQGERASSYPAIMQRNIDDLL